MEKDLLRKEKINARDSLTAEERRERSEAACRRILEDGDYRNAKTVMVYKAVRGELRLDLLESVNASSPEPKRFVYPLCLGKGRMLAVEPGTGDNAWKSGYMGIPEPAAEKGTVTDPADIDLVIAPCSSFDERCGRLGMGRGFYDRYLPRCTKARIIAAAYEAQRSEEIPLGEYDFPVDAVATEERLIRNTQQE